MVDCRLVAQITQSSIGNPDPKTSSDLSSGQSTCGYFSRLLSDVHGCDAHRICSPRWKVIVFFRSKELHGRQSQVRPSQIFRLLAVFCVRQSAISEYRVFGSRRFILGPHSIPYSSLRNCEAFICTKGRCHQQRSGQYSAGKVSKLYCPGFGYTHEHSSVSHHPSTSALFQQPCTKVRNVNMGTSLRTGLSPLRIVYRISR